MPKKNGKNPAFPNQSENQNNVVWKKSGVNIFDFLEGKGEILKLLEKSKKAEISGLNEAALAFQIFGLVCFDNDPGFADAPKAPANPFSPSRHKQLCRSIASQLTAQTPLSEKQPVFLFVKNENEVEKIKKQLEFWQKITECESSINNAIASDAELNKILYYLLQNTPGFYLLSLPQIFQPLPHPSYFKNLILKLSPKQKSHFWCVRTKNVIIKNLLKLGYEEEKKVFIRGTFSRRGGILDVYSLQNNFPYRFEFFGEEIENIYFFDPKTNKKIENAKTAEIIPAKLKKGKSNFLDYFSAINPAPCSPQGIKQNRYCSHKQFYPHTKDFSVRVYPTTASPGHQSGVGTSGGVFSRYGINQKTAPLIIFEEFNDGISFEEKQKFQKAIKNFLQIKIIPFPTSSTKISLSYQSPSFYQRNFSYFQNDIAKLQKQNWQVFILTSHQEALKRLLPEKNLSFFAERSLSFDISGFQNPKTKFIFLTDFEIFGKPKIFPKPKKIDTAFVSELKVGDYIVHLDHGIGKFVGMAEKNIDDIKKEFFKLEYAQADKLYLPIEYADKITKYIGKTHPSIYRLHGALWHNVKEKVKKDAQNIAKKLLELYAEREISSGFIFSADTLAQKELEDSFEYKETEDQIKVLAEIKNDMEGKSEKFSVEKLSGQFFSNNEDLQKELAKKPMDRLLCGDVSFGKTEIAIRAAHKACQDKKQVALLCPTTILAQQHFDTFLGRLKNFPVNIEVISRFQTKSKQKEIVKKLAEGKIDIIIGTHRLLSRDIKFKDLGLLILDEEQRFGVKQKEKLKEKRTNLDVLTLSATPIPRTLHLALSGLRDISLISIPPPDRLPIETFILPYDEKVIAEAVNREVARQGQVYFLHNRVQTIETASNKLKKLLPKIKFEIAHGRMPEQKLAKIMSDFYHKKFDVLVCSSIVENGLDLPNVNTLVVDNATRFGLADLYQLRGRVGRGNRQAYAYFLYQSQNLKERAKKRLEALLEAKELGSGFQIAQKDLEIRGAGNILGKEQSGNLEAVGLALFSRLLSRALEEIKTGKKQEEEFEVTIDLPLSAYISKNFIVDEKKRLLLYRKLANIRDLEELKEFKEKSTSQKSISSNLFYDLEKVKTIKKIPKEFLNLFEILEIKVLARQAKIFCLDTINITPPGRKKFYRLIIKSIRKIKPEAAAKLLQKNPNFQISDFVIKIRLDDLGKNWIFNLKGILKELNL